MTRRFPGLGPLRTFEAAARHLSFTKAAEELGVTPGAVSVQVRAIEDRLGVRLFWRTSRTVRLTGAGETMLRAARERGRRALSDSFAPESPARPS